MTVPDHPALAERLLVAGPAPHSCGKLRRLTPVFVLIGIVGFVVLLSRLPCSFSEVLREPSIAMAWQHRHGLTASAARQPLQPAGIRQFVQPAKAMQPEGGEGRFKQASLPSAASVGFASTSRSSMVSRATAVGEATSDTMKDSLVPDAVTEESPLRVLIVGGGVGGLALADSLVKDPKMKVTVLERTDQFQRFGGPIQLASNALTVLEEMDPTLFTKILEKFTFTGNLKNGIKDGIRSEWFIPFDLKSPADARNMSYTGVIERPDLQELFLEALPPGVVQNGDGVDRYEVDPNGHGVKVFMTSGAVVEGDVLIGADGIWSTIRSTMWNQPAKGKGSGVSYSGYTCFAGELVYDSFDHGEVGYKVYIGPGKYFVVSDIGKGRYQWYAFLARKENSAETEAMPEGKAAYLRNIFRGWSPELHHILDVTKENEIGQRDLYDLPPPVFKPWTKGPVALLGDAVHAMMPNLGQGGCQAIEDAFVISQELKSLTARSEISSKLTKYAARRQIRAGAMHGLSRLASELVINQFGTPIKVSFEGGLKVENFDYLGVLTRFWQPFLPVFFFFQWSFIYECWRNQAAVDLKTAIGFVAIVTMLTNGGILSDAGFDLKLGLDSIYGAAGTADLMAKLSPIR